MVKRTRPGAVVILGVMFAARYPALVPATTRRGLAALGVETPTPRNMRADEARRRYPEHPVAGLAELAWLPGTRHEDVLEQVLAWERDYRIDVVVAFGEGYVEAAAIVADCLGLRGPGLRASRVCRNKLLQRRYLAAFSPRSWLVPAAGRVDTGDPVPGWDAFPAIVKPIGREASSGVWRVDDRAALRTALATYPPDEPVLVEEMVAGHEISVESLVQDGRVIFSAPTGKLTNESDGDNFVEMGHTAPDPELDEAATATVLAVNAAVLDRLAFRDGIAHAEYRVGPDGAVVLMEIAARAAGDSILTLYHLATGTPLEETLLAILLGEPASHPAPRRYARQVYLPHTPGVLRGIRTDIPEVPLTWLDERLMWPDVHPRDAGQPAAVHMVVGGRSVGDELGAIRESSDRAAMFVIDAATPGALDRLEARCRASIHIEVDAGARDRQPALAVAE